MAEPERWEVCGRPKHGPGNYIPEDEYDAHGLLRVDPSKRPAFPRKSWRRER